MAVHADRGRKDDSDERSTTMEVAELQDLVVEIETRHEPIEFIAA